VKLVIDDLPLSKPLGIELNECKVARVHPQGSKWGWQVGDTCVQVGSYPVSTFEEIWARIQIERDRLPCTFLVERQAVAPTYLDYRGQYRDEEEEEADAGSRGHGRTGTHSSPHSRKPTIDVPSGSRKPTMDVPSGSRKATLEVPESHHSGSRTTTLELPGGSRKATLDVPGGSRKATLEIPGGDSGSEDDWHSPGHTKSPAGSRLSSKLDRSSSKIDGGHHSRTVSKLDAIKEGGTGIDLRKAALAALAEAEDQYADFAQPDGQQWWHERQAREELAGHMYRQPTVRKTAMAHNNANRILENRRTIELHTGIRENMTKAALLKVMGELGPVDDCHMGVYDKDGNFTELPWVRFRTVMATEAAMTELRSGNVHMEDETKHGEDRWPKVTGERRQDGIWGVPCGVKGSTPRGAKHVKRDDEDEEDEEQPGLEFGEWSMEPEREETPSEDFYSSVEGWNQYMEMEPEQRAQKARTLWEEARAKDHHNIDGAFNETLPYHAWLENANVTHPEEVGQPREWVCFVCKRGNDLEDNQCRVCSSERGYRNSKLKAAAKPRVLLPEGGIKKIPDSRVVWKKDAWYRSVYEVKK